MTRQSKCDDSLKNIKLDTLNSFLPIVSHYFFALLIFNWKLKIITMPKIYFRINSLLSFWCAISILPYHIFPLVWPKYPGPFQSNWDNSIIIWLFIDGVVVLSVILSDVCFLLRQFNFTDKLTQYFKNIILHQCSYTGDAVGCKYPVMDVPAIGNATLVDASKNSKVWLLM